LTHGLQFKLWNDDGWFSSSYIRQLKTRTVPVAKEENADLDPTKVLAHDPLGGARLDYSAYDEIPTAAPSAQTSLLETM
jgi:hypothetical protein